MPYKLVILPRAERELKKLDRKIFLKIDEIILLLAIDPRPHGFKKLRGTDNIYRIRNGDHRIVYSIEDKMLVIEIIAVANRKDVYKH